MTGGSVCVHKVEYVGLINETVTRREFATMQF